jgi:hypothetical protein
MRHDVPERHRQLLRQGISVSTSERWMKKLIRPKRSMGVLWLVTASLKARHWMENSVLRLRKC